MEALRMKLDHIEKQRLKSYLLENEDVLMQKILDYAETYNYTKYTSTLKEAWRISIEGLTKSLNAMLDAYDNTPEMSPDDDYTKDDAAQFAMLEADKHRKRGVNLSMFLGLLKYYRQSYKDLLIEAKDRFSSYKTLDLFIERFFDRIEIAFCTQWAGLDAELQIKDLSAANRIMTNEKNKYLTVFDSIASAVVLIDKDGFIENLNCTAEDIFKNRNVPGTHYYSNSKAKETFIWLNYEINSLITSGRNEVRFEKELETQQKQYIFDVKIQKLHDISNKFAGYTVVLNDITDLKTAQEKLILSEKMASLGSLVAGVAHEINTPVGIGISSVTHLKENTAQIKKAFENDNISVDEFSDYLNSNVELCELTYLNLGKAAELVKSFKQVAVDQSLEEMRQFNVKEYIEEVLLSLKSKLKEANPLITINCPADLSIKSFAGSFSQIITNFVMNSLTHGLNKANGEISFDAAVNGSELIFTYSDNGRGIDKKNLYKIFDPFFTTKRESGNTGLGLHIVYKIVTERLKGKIECKSDLGKGAEFRISIPIEAGKRNGKD
ncbi:signal transduction histidine kinase [Candidatus Magnetoovum chiemensis]|nr:signal transduction histidine kinase [Candidatus Magnetoovum chiemensis]